MSSPDGRTLFRAWQLCRAAGVNLFKPGIGSTLSGVAGWPSLRLAADADRSAIVESLRALELLARSREGSEAPTQLVATIPGYSSDALSTRDAARALVDSAKTSLLIIGYAISDDDFCDQLMRKGLEGIPVTAVSDRDQVGALELLRRWPAAAAPLRALHGVEREPGNYGAVHGKVIAADRHRAIVGSANFTLAGFRGNLEFGVKIEGPPVKQLCGLVEQLSQRGWLVEIGL